MALHRKLGKSLLGSLLMAFLMAALLFSVLALLVLKLVLPRKRYAGIAWPMQGVFLTMFVWLYEYNSNLRLMVSGDTIPRGESSLVISNHVTHDYFPLYSLAARTDLLGGFKVIVKKSLLYVPFFGLGMWLCDFVFLARDWQRDREYLAQQLQVLGATQLPLQLILFPEGTRKTKKNFAKSVEFAKKKGVPEPKHVLIPRTKGLLAVVNGLRSGSAGVQHVYDVTLAYTGWKNNGKYDGPGPSGVFFPWGQGDVTMHVHVKRHSLDSLPADDTELTDWCFERFREKDQLLEAFAKSGDTDTKRSFPGAKPSHFPGTAAAIGALAVYMAIIVAAVSTMLLGSAKT